MKTTIQIEGMSCAHCSKAVEKALQAVAGVDAVQVDLAQKTATVESDANVAPESLKAAVTDAGYEVVDVRRNS